MAFCVLGPDTWP